MSGNKKTLVILESPNKISKVSSCIGSKYVVLASCGHMRDLNKKTLSIDTDDGFKPSYYIDNEKKQVIKDLKKNYEKYKDVLLACDYDREGEAIAFHISEILKIPKNNRKRMLFTEITKSALNESLKQIKTLDMNMFHSQQARRIIDRLIGWKISPLLWKNIQNSTKKGESLSAGRVQSVVNRLILEREKIIKEFNKESYFNTQGKFSSNKNNLICTLDKRITTKEKSEDFLETCANSDFKIDSISSLKSSRKPSPPFTTSTLQQEASNKFRISPKQTMSIAQKLYVNGLITYMRTDSTILSEDVLDNIEKYVKSNYKDKYYKRRQYKTSSKNSQEAHEAIRPCNIELNDLSTQDKYSVYEVRIYNLIWKRTIASQMSDCSVETITLKIGIYEESVKHPNTFISKIENILFDGFTKIYSPFVDKENCEDELVNNNQIENIKHLKKNTPLKMKNIICNEKYTKPKSLRFTEASLIKKLEKLGIGRPSTFSSMVSIVQDRKYAIKKDVEGEKKKCCQLMLVDDTIEESYKEITINAEKQKLVPTEIGQIVNGYLMKHFSIIFSDGFTQKLEDNLDNIASGKLEWVKMVADVYKLFNPVVIKINRLSSGSGSSREKDKYSRIIGRDAQTGFNVCTYIAKYGPVVQLKNENNPSKSKFAPLKDIKMEDVTLEQALELLKYPYVIGKFENKDIQIAKGKFGVYIKHDGKNYSLFSITEENLTTKIAIDIIKKKNGGKTGASSNIVKKITDDIVIKNGQYGHYINYKNKHNIKIYSKKKVTELTESDCMAMINKKLGKK